MNQINSVSAYTCMYTKPYIQRDSFHSEEKTSLCNIFFKWKKAKRKKVSLSAPHSCCAKLIQSHFGKLLKDQCLRIRMSVPPFISFSFLSSFHYYYYFCRMVCVNRNDTLSMSCSNGSFMPCYKIHGNFNVVQ